MLDEMLSAIAGNAIAKLISKFAPARKSDEFSATPVELLERRNKRLYHGLLAAFGFGFFFPYLFMSSITEERRLWLPGAIFGLPFFVMLVFILLIWRLLGSRRARELLFYFETEQKIDMRIFYLLGAPLSVIGVISFLMVVWP